tara:strand:+ start:1303 stop:1731 length:429 start_codon:yes stop_codon:yes gene_type:complete
MKITMEEIDLFIKKWKEEQEMSDYIHKNIYPESLKPKKIHNYKPLPLDELKINNDYLEDIQPKYEFKLEHTILDKLRNLENVLKENIDNRQTCPVCFESLNNNFVSPSCGHSICIRCFTTNIRQNNVNCELCCLCRKNIVSI